jgi:hypothetical protein
MKLKSRFFKKHHNRAALLILTLIPLGLFQNCSDVNFQTVPMTKAEIDMQIPAMRINNGAEYTKDANVLVQLYCYGGKEMYVTNDSTCAADGVWEPFRTERGWMLNQQNQGAAVYAKFKRINKYGVEELTECVSANIVHDNVPPVIAYNSGPDALSREVSGRIEFSVSDNLSGIEKSECKLDAGLFGPCENAFELMSLNEGSHRFAVKAVDKAGNEAAAIELPWLVDITKPVVQILDPKPPVLSTSNTAAFTFSGNDFAGSGIEKYMCQITGEAAAPCESPFVRANLSDGVKTFSVYAIDKVGLVSDVASYNWTISTTPSGAFNILGITGAHDSKLDAYLAGDVYPRVSWSASQNTIGYDVGILNAAGSAVVCPKVSVNALAHQFASSCALVHGVSYRAVATAYNSANLATNAPQFPFTVDIVGPAITIAAPTIPVDHKSAQITFSVVDPISGVDTAVCSHTYNNVVTTYACKGITQLNLANLLPGTHKFNIAATDIAGNSSVGSEISFVLENRTLENQVVLVEQPPTKLDVLMVIDNSSSMNLERQKLSEKLADFIGKLDTLDWRICLTTTSPTTDGQLRSFGTVAGVNVYKIDKLTPNYNTLFLNAVKGDLGNASGDEQGIYATVRAIETKDTRCFRDDSAMAVVVISDEDERSWGGYPEYSAETQFKVLNAKNYPQAAVDAIKAKYGLSKIFTFHSIVIKYNDTACKIESAGQYGRRYEELSALTSGIVGSLCSANYGTELAKMAERIKSNLGTITLRCVPVANTLQVDINPMVAGQTSSTNGDKVTFTPLLTAGTVVSLQYYCSR